MICVLLFTIFDSTPGFSLVLYAAPICAPSYSNAYIPFSRSGRQRRVESMSMLHETHSVNSPGSQHFAVHVHVLKCRYRGRTNALRHRECASRSVSRAMVANGRNNLVFAPHSLVVYRLLRVFGGYFSSRPVLVELLPAPHFFVEPRPRVLSGLGCPFGENPTQNPGGFHWRAWEATRPP